MKHWVGLTLSLFCTLSFANTESLSELKQLQATLPDGEYGATLINNGAATVEIDVEVITKTVFSYGGTLKQIPKHFVIERNRTLANAAECKRIFSVLGTKKFIPDSESIESNNELDHEYETKIFKMKFDVSASARPEVICMLSFNQTQIRKHFVIFHPSSTTVSVLRK